MTLPACVVHCPSLGRDLTHIRKHVPDVQVLETPRTPFSHDGCIAGHQAAVRQAQAHHWPAVMVLEDDCTFTDAFAWPTWIADVQWAATHGYTVLTGGAWSARNPRWVRDGLYAVDWFKSSHCVVYLADAYPLVAQLRFPMDVMIGKLGARIVLTSPFVAIQASGYSGIQDRLVDDGPGYRRHEARLAQLEPA